MHAKQKNSPKQHPVQSHTSTNINQEF